MHLMKNEYIIRCSCQDLSHLIRLGFWKEKSKDGADYDYLDLDISLTSIDAPLWQRIKNAFFYIFKQRKFWAYGDVLLNLLDPEGRGELKGLIKFLRSVEKEAKAIIKERTDLNSN